MIDPLRIVFFGTPAFSVPFLNALIEAEDMDVVAVVTQPDKPVGRTQEQTPSAASMRATEAGIEILKPKTLKNFDVHDELRALNADVFVVVAYGKLIPPRALAIPRLGCVNVHPSKLPAYRGPAPMQASILSGDDKTAVSIMLLDEGMDTGPLLGQKELSVTPDETLPSLTQKVQGVGAPFLIQVLRMYADGVAKPVPQSGEPSITSLLTRDSGRIDWNQSAVQIERMVRAYQPWPGTHTTWEQDGETRVLKLLSVEVAETASLNPGQLSRVANEFLIGCEEDAVKLIEVQPAGKRPMSGSDFLKGYPNIETFQ